jgi:hypothetical protein
VKHNQRWFGAAIGVVGVLVVSSCGGASEASARPAATRASTTTQASIQLPAVGVAGTAACQADALTIKTAESSYSLLNGRYASLPELAAEQFLRRASTYYSEAEIGDPPGGYTLVGVPGKCGNWPVAGPD